MTSSAPPADPPPVRARRPFRLTRYFSVASLVGILVVTGSLFWTYRQLTIQHLVEHETRANADLTRAFANTVWTEYRGFVRDAAGLSRDQLLASPAMPRLRADVLEKMRGLQVAKIKIYDRDGLTVFSTDARQIGENKRANPAFQKALHGEAVGEITYREKFDAMENVLNQRNLIASYVPVRAAADGPVEGVFEVYSDVTELLDAQVRAQWQVAGIVLALLSTLYVFLFVVVRKADRVIARQEQERAEREEQVRHQAYHDALTGLPNRAYFAERLSETLALAQRHGHTAALMFVDLDRFKIVNDSLGHQAGDQLLQVVSERLHGCLRQSDLLFRMGGDEFTIILPVIEAPEDAAFIARRILEAVALPVSVHEHELTVGATIGIAVFPGDGDSAETLLKHADAAMYSAKAQGRGRHAFYGAAMNERASQRLELETALHKGFRDGEFTLHYQPRLDAATRQVVAFEALLRWDSPSRGLVPPGEFIGVLEDTGQIAIVGEWALRSACNQLVRWRAAGRAPQRIAVNVSAVHFQSATFVPMVQRVLAETGAPPSLIELELTEAPLIAHPAPARAAIAALKAMGLRVAIDGFGAGSASLLWLQASGADGVRLDRSFVRRVSAQADGRDLVAATVGLARALGLDTVAVGIETDAQARLFADARCDGLQGFFFGAPQPAERLGAHLARHESGHGTRGDTRPAPLFAG